MNHFILRKLASVCLAGSIAVGMTALLQGLPASAASESFDDGILTYTVLQNKDVEVTSCATTTSNVSIMPNIDGYTVVSIAAEAFSGCTDLQSVTIPNSITEIGDGAFSQCTSLKSIKIPDSIEKIPDGAFAYCTALEDITFGSNVTEIGAVAFGYCTALTELTLPDGLTTLGDQAFYYCTALETVSFPESLTTLGAYEFYGCVALQDFTIPATVEDMGVMPFLGCTNMSNIEVETGNPTYVSVDGIVYNLDQDVLYAYPAGRTETSFTIPDDVLVVYAGAFFANTYLEEVLLNDGLQYIGEGAFDYCSKLTAITIPESVTTIQSNAFSDCENLMDVTFVGTDKEDGGTGSDLEIGDYAFYCCESLGEVTLPKRVTTVGDYAFGCTEMTSSSSTDSSSESSTTSKQVVPIDNFLLIGYNGAASDYVKNSDVSISFKSLDFSWKPFVFWVIAGAVVLIIVILAIICIRRNRLQPEEKQALAAAKEERKVPLAEREKETQPKAAEEEDDGYESILGADDDAETNPYQEVTAGSGFGHQFGHAQETEEIDKNEESQSQKDVK